MNRRSAILVVVGLVILAAAAYAAVAVGIRDGRMLTEPGWPVALWSGNDGLMAEVIRHLRLPRCAAALLAGTALAVSGLLLQGITRNPLADPFLLGISGGAGLSLVIVNAFPFLTDLFGWWILPAAAFAGAQGATLLVLFLARGTGGKVSVMGLVLAGVIINAFCAALMTFLVMQFEPLRMKATSIWLAGGIGYFRWNNLALAAALIGFGLIYTRLQAASLNAFTLGEEGAALVGVDATAVLYRSTWVASILAGTAVSLGGLIGYVGLLVPHMVRLLAGRDFRNTIVLSAIGGALMLLIGDTAARVLLAPEEIPVGILAALIGTPLLLALLARELRS